jgi:hypothetical protein
MIRDNVTGLIWEAKTDDDSVHDKDNTYTWCDINPATNGGDAGTCGVGTDTTDFITALNNSNYGGHADWRLPTIKELSTIVNMEIYDPGINNTFFPNTVPSYYWSSTTYVLEIDKAWSVKFDYCGVNNKSKSNSYCARAVCGEQPDDTGNFVDKNDGTITDISTGLMWQKATQSERSWESAIASCESLPLANYDDWRLPDRNELLSLVDYSRYYAAIDPSFPGTEVSYYWSSTTCTGLSSYAWTMYFANGISFQGHKTVAQYFVRAVRSTQSSPKNKSLPNIQLLLLQ